MMERCEKSLHHVQRCAKMFDRCSGMLQDVRKEPVKDSSERARSDGLFDGNRGNTDRIHIALMMLSNGFSRG